jgi:hypothetical protein
MLLRRLTQTGIQRFSAFLDSLSSEFPEPYPEDLLENQEDSTALGTSIEIDRKSFSNRFEAASYLDQRFSRGQLSSVEYDTGIWAWLALFFFEQLCRQDEEGHYLPGEMARWIPENDNFRKYYRHLLRGPYSIYAAHREDPTRVMALLCGPLREPGDVVEQLSARQELVTNAGVMETATILYYDAEGKKLRRGAAGRGPGSARRLADLFNQFDVTWDLYGMPSGGLLGLLPREFDRFRPRAAS